MFDQITSDRFLHRIFIVIIAAFASIILPLYFTKYGFVSTLFFIWMCFCLFLSFYLIYVFLIKDDKTPPHKNLIINYIKQSADYYVFKIWAGIILLSVNGVGYYIGILAIEAWQ